jgi:ABC-type molybdate transport system substrate-binding protein
MSTKINMMNDFVAATNAVENFMHQLSEEELYFSMDGKWNALEQLEHLNKSIKPITLAYKIPKFFLGLYFGKSNRPSKTYEQIVKKYLLKLKAANPTTNPFGPKPEKKLNKASLLYQYNKLNNLFIKQINNTSEQELEIYILPHPLLGKLTLTEMTYFTTYHNLHHLQIIKQQLHG